MATSFTTHTSAELMADFEHPIAVHWDAAGARQMIRAEDLYDDTTFANAKNLELYDDSEQVRVYAREGTDTRRRHFRSETTGSRGFDRGESNPEHDARVDKILVALQGLNDGWKLAYQSYANTPLQTIFGPLPAYHWGAEVTRILSCTASVRQDIYGERGIRMSTRSPSIAVEVIHSHYPEEATFAALLAHSAEVPFIVFFEFTRLSGNTLVKVDQEAQTLFFRSYTYAVTDGALWRGDRRLDEVKTSAHFEVVANMHYKGWK
jgi:hypothetical protein